MVKNIRSLTEGAILLAAFAVLLLLTIYVPIVGMVMNLFISLPFMLFAAKNDWKSTIVFIIASLLISLIVGSILSIPLTFAYGTTGAVMGILIKRKKGRMAILVSGAFVFLANVLIIYGISIYFFKFNMIQEMLDLLRSSLNTSFEMLKNMGQSNESEKLKEQFDKVFALTKTLMPTLFVTSSFFIVFIIQAVSIPIVKRFGIKIEKWSSFRELSLPRNLLWYFLIIMAASLILHPKEGTYWEMTFLNLTYILYYLMVFQGYSFMFYFFHKKGLSKSTSIPLVIITFVIPFLLYIVGILGIMDLGFDLRKRLEK